MASTVRSERAVSLAIEVVGDGFDGAGQEIVVRGVYDAETGFYGGELGERKG